MISVLILDGFADGSACNDTESVYAVKDVFIPLLISILRFNGVVTEVVDSKKLGKVYSVLGDRNSVIYAPKFSCSENETDTVSFIYTDSSSSTSVSFMIASKLRNIRQAELSSVVFVNELKSYDNLKKYSPIVVDDMRFFKTTAICDMTENVFKTAVTVAKSICEHFGLIFRDILL